MSLRFRRSILVLLLIAAPLIGGAQAPFCDNEKKIDSTINWISKTYDYTSQGWQDACDSLLGLCPDLDQVWQMKAMPAIKTGDWYNCYSNLVHAVEIRPAIWLPYQAMLKCLFTKDYRGALKDFQRCDSMQKGGATQDHSYNFYMGLCCLGLKDFSRAAMYLKRDIGDQEKYRGPANVHFVSLMYWGLCQLQSGDYEGARASFQRSLKAYPKYPEALYYLGVCRKAQGQAKEAHSHFYAARESLLQGNHSNEDQEFYVNYPFSIGVKECEEQMKNL